MDVLNQQLQWNIIRKKNNPDFLTFYFRFSVLFLVNKYSTSNDFIVWKGTVTSNRNCTPLRITRTTAILVAICILFDVLLFKTQTPMAAES